MAKNYFGITDTGKQRTNNEDTFIAEKINRQFITACVIDGLGGYEGGEVAAALAKNAIAKALAKPAPDVTKQLRDAIISANNSIQQEKKKQVNENYNHMACVVTLSLADIANNKFYYAHVGDTRLYLLRDKSLVKITKDQSFVGFLEDNGRLTEEEAMQHPKRNEINKALGFDAGIDSDDYIEIGDSPFLPGDMLLLCSDGLTDMINSSTMTSILNSNKTLQQKGEALVQAANDAGGNDNITVVLVHNDKPQIKHTATKPATQKKTPEQIGDPTSSTEPIQRFPVIGIDNKSNKMVIALSVLLAISLMIVGWLYYQLKQQKEAMKTGVNGPASIEKRNIAEQALNDSITSTIQPHLTIANEQGDQPIVISDTILIDKDSLTIHGNGTRLISDSAYKGPAFVLSQNCHYVLFDSLSFENFDAAILVQQGGLHAKNIRFVNCKIPVIQQFNFPAGMSITGGIPLNLFKTDSLSK